MNTGSPFRLPGIVIVALVFFFCASISDAEQSHRTRAADLSTVEATMTAFCQAGSIETCFPEKELKEFKMAQMKWQQTGYEKDWKELTGAIYVLSKSNNLRSRVTISTEPRNGANVYYQTWTERQEKMSPARFADPTVATEELFLGEYFIWVERNGKPTSDRDATYRVVKTHHEWTIQETGKSP